MPMRPLNWNSCSSRIVLTSSPNTVMVPESGYISPSTSLSRTLLPLPAGPSRIRVSPGDTVSEISSRTFLPSNPIETSSKTTTGCDGSCSLFAAVCWGAVTISLEAEDTDHEPAYHEVDEDNEHRRDHHRLGSGAANALGTAACVHTVEAADTGNDEAKNDGFHQSLKNVGIAQRLVGGMKVLRAVLSEHDDRHERAAHCPHRVGDDSEEKQHDHRGEKPRRYQLFEWIGAQRPHGIDLFGHHHGAELTGHSRRVAAG